MIISPDKWSSFFLFQGGRRYLLGMAFCLALSAVLGGQVPHAITNLANFYGTSRFNEGLILLTAIFVGTYFNRALYQIVINKYILLLIQHVRTWCYNQWLDTHEVQTSTKNTSDRYPQGELLARMMNDTESVRELITSGTFAIFINLFFVASCLIQFMTLNPKMGGLLAVAEVLCAVLLIFGSRSMRDIFLKVRRSRGIMSRTLANLVGGVSQTYYSNHNHYALKKGEVAFDDFLKNILKSNIYDASYYSVAESLYPLLLLLVGFAFPYVEIQQAAIVLALVDLIQRSINPIKEIASKVANIQRAYTGFLRISEFLKDLDPRPSEDPLWTEGIKSMKVDVKEFSYPEKGGERFQLKNISFEAKASEMIGLVGLSGSGKSTLLQILTQTVIQDKGTIELSYDSGKTLIVNHDDENSRQQYKYCIGLVSQESHLFSESLYFNIGLNQKTREEFDTFWNKMKVEIPYLAEWGIDVNDVIHVAKLSLGQKQLLAALRSLFLNKPIVLFDEIASGLDTALESALRRMVQLIQGECLTFIVAHRLETIIDADRILVMNEGSLVDSGKHQELLQSSLIYQEFLQELAHEFA